MASIGGFIAGDFAIVDYIKHHARSLIFSASIPPANTATVLAALQVMKEEPERIERVNQNGAFMRQGFKKLGFNTGASCTPVVPIIIGDDALTFESWRRLFEEGVFVNPVISPILPQVGSYCAPATWLPTRKTSWNMCWKYSKKSAKNYHLFSQCSF